MPKVTVGLVLQIHWMLMRLWSLRSKIQSRAQSKVVVMMLLHIFRRCFFAGLML